MYVYTHVHTYTHTLIHEHSYGLFYKKIFQNPPGDTIGGNVVARAPPFSARPWTPKYFLSIMENP